MTKLVNENRTDWHDHLSIVLFSYISTWKVTIGYTPYQLVYGLHPLMPTEYIVPIANGNKKNNTTMKVLTNKILELEKLQEAKMQAAQTIYIQ